MYSYYTIETEKCRHSSPALLEAKVQKLLPMLARNLTPGTPVSILQLAENCILGSNQTKLQQKIGYLVSLPDDIE